MLPLGYIWRAGSYPPAVGAAVVGLVGAEGEGTGRGRTRADGRIYDQIRSELKG